MSRTDGYKLPFQIKLSAFVSGIDRKSLNTKRYDELRRRSFYNNLFADEIKLLGKYNSQYLEKIQEDFTLKYELLEKESKIQADMIRAELKNTTSNPRTKPKSLHQNNDESIRFAKWNETNLPVPIDLEEILSKKSIQMDDNINLNKKLEKNLSSSSTKNEHVKANQAESEESATDVGEEPALV